MVMTVRCVTSAANSGVDGMREECGQEEEDVGLDFGLTTFILPQST